METEQKILNMWKRYYREINIEALKTYGLPITTQALGSLNAGCVVAASQLVQATIEMLKSEK